jgi:hypothetical protein
MKHTKRTGYGTPRHPLGCSYLFLKMEWPGNKSSSIKYKDIIPMMCAGFYRNHKHLILLQFKFSMQKILESRSRKTKQILFTCKLAKWLLVEAALPSHFAISFLAQAAPSNES